MASALLVRICCFSALGGFLFGYDLGLIGGALQQVRRLQDVRRRVRRGAGVHTLRCGAMQVKESMAITSNFTLEVCAAYACVQRMLRMLA